MDSGPGSSILPEILLLILLISINAFFAAAEMAIVSSNKNKIDMLAEEGNLKARLLRKLLKEPSKFLATIQVAITLSGFLASASAATSITKYFTPFLIRFNIPYAEEISVVLITLVLSYFSLVFGELVPKRMALNNSENVSLFVVKPLIYTSKIFLPFVKLLSASTNAVIKLFGVEIDDLEDKVSEEEIKSLIDAGQENGIINDSEREMLDGIFEFDDKLAKEVMTPRTEVFMINIDTPVKKIMNEVLNEKYTRIPIYENDIDNIIGILYIKDLFIKCNKEGIDKINIRDILRPAYFVPETKSTDQLFKELKNTKNHMAILIDEYGGFSGIVTIEDLIEEVMGNIFDEYDENVPDIKKVDDNTYVVNGLLSIDEVNDILDLNLESDKSDTIGGFLVNLLGCIPNDDQDSSIEYKNLIFKIDKVSEKRIERLSISILPEKEKTLDKV